MSDLILQCLVENGRGYNKLTTMKQIELQMFELFLSIANAQFEWEGLPKELKPYNLEKILNLYGQAVVFKYGDDLVACSCANTSFLNIYGEPVSVQPIALNGMTFDVVNVKTTINSESKIVSQNAVLIKNNMMAIPTYFLIKPFVEKLCFIWESMGINAGLSRVKYLIHANKQLANNIKTEIKKLVGGDSMIPVVNEKINVMNEIEKLDFNIPYEPEKYWVDFDKTFALCCQLVGITTNMSQDKKERLIVSEVESNDELTTLTEDTRLDYRKQGCEEINTLFGYNISVDNKVQDIKMTQATDNVDVNDEKEN